MMRTQEQYIINGPLCRNLLSLQFPQAMGIAYQPTGAACRFGHGLAVNNMHVEDVNNNPERSLHQHVSCLLSGDNDKKGVTRIDWGDRAGVDENNRQKER
eukprot:scaffold156819_cov31-Attheya_sp.AAC.1